MQISEYITAIARNGELLAEAAQRAGLTAAVPSCPPWQVRDLLRHQGYVHRWATSYVAEQQQDEMPELTEAEQLAAGPDDAGLLAWFLAGCRALTGTLSSADPQVQCWTFLPAPSPLAFWARRQAHETAVHRVDAELATGAPTEVPAGLAADGIAELLLAFFGRGQDQPAARADDRVLAVRAADTGQDWHVRLTSDGKHIVGTGPGSDATAPDSAAPGCTVSGPASQLYLLLWNRTEPAAAGLSVSGDAGLLHAWHDGMRVTWG